MKKFFYSFILASVSFVGFSQTPCANNFNVSNNGGGGACSNDFPGNGIGAANSKYKRDGLIEIRFEGAVGSNITPVITAIRAITSPVGQPITVGQDLDMKFALKGFLGTTRTTAEYCFFSQNNLNLNNGSGSRYQVDVSFISSAATTSTVCNIRQSPDAIILPVTFGDFVAQRKTSSSVFLKWSTLTEQNSKGFYVQRNNGNGWKDAGFVFSQTNNGYSSSNLVYEFKDVNGEKATTQYRILQVDNDGHGKYSDVRLVRGEAGSGKVVLYPNPTNTGKVSIAFESNSERDITVHDMAGRVVKQLTKVTSSIVVIDGLTSGFYTIQTLDRATSEVTREKLVVNNK